MLLNGETLIYFCSDFFSLVRAELLCHQPLGKSYYLVMKIGKIYFPSRRVLIVLMLIRIHFSFLCQVAVISVLQKDGSQVILENHIFNQQGTCFFLVCFHIFTSRQKSWVRYTLCLLRQDIDAASSNAPCVNKRRGFCMVPYPAPLSFCIAVFQFL
jgi:hypothetical protein